MIFGAIVRTCIRIPNVMTLVSQREKIDEIDGDETFFRAGGKRTPPHHYTRGGGVQDAALAGIDPHEAATAFRDELVERRPTDGVDAMSCRH